MSDLTSILGLPLVAASQAQKHVTVNEGLAVLDSLVQLSVMDRTATAPPGSPAEGDRHIIAAPATGDWAGEDGKLAVFDGGAWAFLQPNAGWRAWVGDEGREVVHNGTSWIPAIAFSANEANISLEVIEENLSLSGASVDTSITIPDRAIVFSVSTRTTVAITGASSFDCGIAAETSKFGGTLGIALESNNSGVIGPTAFYSPTAIRLTANGSNFTGGTVRVAIHYMLCGAPQS